MRLSFTQKLKIAWMALFHKKTPFAAKAVLIGGAFYGLMPIDIIPDIIPLIGMFDDAVALALAIIFFLRVTKGIRQDLSTKRDVIDVEAV